MDGGAPPFEALFDLSPTALVVSRPGGKIDRVNPAFEALFGISEEKAAGQFAGDLGVWRREEDRSRVLARLEEEGEVRGLPVRFRAAGGPVLEAEVSVRRVGFGKNGPESRGVEEQGIEEQNVEDDDGERLLWAIRDVTERNRRRREEEAQDLYDAATGLPSRAFLLGRMRLAIDWAEEFGEPVSLVGIDIDDFAAVNEKLGHETGDEVLGTLARRVEEAARDLDTAARIAGDEFALLLYGAREEEARQVAERLRRRVEAPISQGGNSQGGNSQGGETLHLAVTVGISSYDPARDDPPRAEALLQSCETALSRAKEEGTSLRTYRPEDQRHADRLLRKERLREAIEEEELRLFYHPIVDLRGGSVPEAEALIRWDHPEKGLLSPGAFIPLAERTGLIREIDRWVLKEATRQVARWRSTGAGPPCVSVNVTAPGRSGAAFQAEVSGLLQERGLPGKALTLELTERVLLEEAQPFARLRAEGVRLAIDDFGTGYSSLFYLRNLEADMLKIDRRFIEGIVKGQERSPKKGAQKKSAPGNGAEETGASVLVEATLWVAGRLGFEAVAEGIETEAQRKRLEAMGCPLGQGYLFGKPMPPAELEETFFRGEEPPR